MTSLPIAYKEGGPAAEARFEAGVAGFEARAFRGCGVFTSEPFEVSDDADSVQMLTRSSQVGEFYVMMPPQVMPTGGEGSNLHTADMLIYDEESDKHVRITWADALDATLAAGLGNDAKVSKGHSGFIQVNGADGTTDTWMALAKQVSAYSSGVTHDSRKSPTKVASAVTWENLSASGALDIRIVVARPFIEHLMHNVILAVSGRETGATLFGPADMQLSANTQVKTIEGHYTGHFKAVVTKPQNVMVMRDVACAGYVAGGNCSSGCVYVGLGQQKMNSRCVDCRVASEARRRKREESW